MARGKRSNLDLSNNSTNSGSTSIHQQQRLDDKTFLLQRLLSIKLPRCSVCETSWFCDDPLERNIKDFHRDNIEEYIHKKAKDLIPMPECSCTTTLVTNPKAQELDKILNRIEEAKYEKVSKNVDDTTMVDILLHQSTLTLQDLHHFPQKGMCKQCVQSQMKASNEVFQDGTETNVTVATKCPLCSKKFSSRNLQRRLDQCMIIDNTQFELPFSTPSSKSSNSSSKKKDNIMEWYHAVVNTLKFVRYTKRLKARMIQNALTIPSSSSKSNSDDNDDSKFTSHDEQQRINDIHVIISSSKDFLDEWHEDESSDDCFSCNSSSSIEDDSDCEDNHNNHSNQRKNSHINNNRNKTQYSSDTIRNKKLQAKKNRNIIAPEEGELKRYYTMHCNPHYEQECKDEEYAKELQRQINNDEDNQHNSKKEQEANDAELARQLQEQLKQKSNNVETPLKEKKYPIIESLKKYLPRSRSTQRQRQRQHCRSSTTSRSTSKYFIRMSDKDIQKNLRREKLNPSRNYSDANIPKSSPIASSSNIGNGSCKRSMASTTSSLTSFKNNISAYLTNISVPKNNDTINEAEVVVTTRSERISYPKEKEIDQAQQRLNKRKREESAYTINDDRNVIKNGSTNAGVERIDFTCEDSRDSFLQRSDGNITTQRQSNGSTNHSNVGNSSNPIEL